MKNFSVIAAADEGWGIGKDGIIPWRFPEDFKWFKHMTSGNPCFMGYNTYKELADIMKGKKELLPGRKCIVVSSKDIDDSRITVCRDLTAFADYTDAKENFFIGGTSIFDFGLDHADWVYLTQIPGDHDCNVKFPKDKLLQNFTLNRVIDLSDVLKVNVYERNQK